MPADFDTRLTRVETTMELHVAECNRRAAIAARLLWYVVGVATASFGALVKLAFHL